MFNVKEGVEVKTRVDLQNLIISVILRQANEFTLDDIVRGANVRLLGSKYFESEELVKNCDDTLNMLFLFNGVQMVKKGRYEPTMSLPAVSVR